LRGRYRAWRGGVDKTPKPWKHMLDAALKLAGSPKGCILEFGVYNGKTLNFLAARRPQAQLHGFDSFAGFPDDGRVDWHQDMAVADLPEMVGNIQLHIGYFAQTLPGFAATHHKELGNIGLVHIDCDLYSSTKTVFDAIGPYLRPGQVIVFDELMNYREFAQNEFLAFYEFLQQHQLDFEWAATIGNAFPYREQNGVMANQRFGPYRAQGYFQNQSIRLLPRAKGQHFSARPAPDMLVANLAVQLGKTTAKT